MATNNPIDLSGVQIDQQGIDRQRAIAALMQQDSLSAPEGQMISGHYVAPSITQYMAKVARALSANSMNKDLDAKAKALQMQGMQNIMGFLPSSSQAQPSGPTALPSSDAGGAAPPQQQPTQQQTNAPVIAGGAAGSVNPFGAQSLMRSKALAMLGGDPAAAAYWKQYEPTDATKMAMAAGADPRMANQQALQKSVYIPPTSLRPGGYVQNPDGTRQQMPNVPEGFQAVDNGQGGWQIIPVSGGTQAMAASEAAKLAGRNTQTLLPKELMPTNASGTVNPMTVSTAVGGGTPASGLGAAFGAESGARAQETGQVESMQNSYKGLQTVRAGGNMALEDIGKMQALASQKNPLTAGPLAKYAGIVSPNAAVYEKSRDNLVTNLSGQLGMSTDSAREMVYGSIPAYGAPKEAIANGLNTLKNQVTQRMLKADLLTKVYNSGDARQYNDTENLFDQNISPKLAGIISMPAGPERAAALKSAASNQQDRQGLEWAAQNGVLK